MRPNARPTTAESEHADAEPNTEKAKKIQERLIGFSRARSNRGREGPLGCPGASAPSLGGAPA